MYRQAINRPWFLKQVSNSLGFPCLQSKAAASKRLTLWLCNKAQKFARRDGATQADKVVASAMFAYAGMLRIMKEGQHILTEDQAGLFKSYTLQHLKCYAWLHDYGMRAALRTPGRKCWLLLPKLHHLWHLAHDVARTKVNPGMVMLLNAESFIGSMGKIARATHRSTVSKRTLERYLAKLCLTLDD